MVKCLFIASCSTRREEQKSHRNDESQMNRSLGN